MSAVRPRIATIPLDAPFLERLAQWWLREGGEAFADALFLLPTRRAARGLGEALLRASEGRALLLPRITALGAIDETPLALAGRLVAPPPVDPARRLAVLSRWILAMRGAHGAPETADRAWRLAAELAALLDEAARAEIDLADGLPLAVAGDLATHWAVTLDFLAIVTRQWPAWLAEQGLADLAASQIASLDAQARAWREAPPAHPVIAAGSTGAIPAVARLLHVVSRLPRGQVVLPGLDLELDEASWEALTDTHPQASLRRLLRALDARRGDVESWGGTETGRAALFRRALLPAGSLAQWQSGAAPDTDGIALLPCRDEAEEALAVALALRSAIEKPGAQAALITPDRGLAARVAAELLRFGIVADDSAGEALAETPPALFLRLLADAVMRGLPPVPLLALLKHPLAAAGLAPARCRAEARRLERDCLRGARAAPGLQAMRRQGGDGAFLDRLAGCLAPLLALAPDRPVAPAATLLALIEAAEALAATDEQPGAERLWSGEEGAALAEHLSALLEAFGDLPPEPPARLPDLLAAALAGIAVRTRRAVRGREGAEHPRIFIWGRLEARLQAVDLAVLGGLAEGSWPEAADPGPWLSRRMREAVGLPSPEEAIGLAAHDFVSVCCAAGEVVLAVPARRERAPSVPSRWVVRLEAMLRGQGARLAVHDALAWARALDLPAGPARPVAPPQPRPPVALRPRKLKVTEIETWLRDPYAIYAKHVLQLRPLEPLEPGVGAVEFGQIVHDGLARFYREHGAAWPEGAAGRLRRAMDEALEAAAMPASSCAWWRPRLRRIADWVAETEVKRRVLNPPAALWAEIPGRWDFEAPGGLFSLRGRADRIERRPEGGLAVIDYKTGEVPSEAQVERGEFPQLPLEAAMLQAGAFGEVPAGSVVELAYWKISGGREPGAETRLFEGDAARLAAQGTIARERLAARIAAYDRFEQAYLAQPHPEAVPRFGKYGQLARAAEWMGLGVGEDSGF